MIKRFLASASRVIGMLALTLLLFQCQLIYMPSRYPDLAKVNQLAKPIEFTTSQGRQVAWLRAGPSDAAPVWLVFGGNGSRAMDYYPHFNTEARRADSVLFVDFPGYGDCAGRPTPDHIRETIVAAVPALANQMQRPIEALRPRLRVFGHSMGAAAALMAMREHRIQRGLLIAPFARMLDMARLRVGWPLCHLLHHRFDNLAELDHLAPGTQIEVIHGTHDEVIPPPQSDLLATAHPEHVHLTKVEGAKHNAILHTHRELLQQLMTQIAQKTPQR
jgi:uncharacterized protein